MGRRIRSLAITVAVALPGVVGASPAQAGGGPALVHLGQIARQDVPPRPGSEPDTLVEPDVAVDPADPRVAVAVAHDGRYPDGGAVAITHAWTRDGGRTWRHAPVAGLTTATGGRWARASDPVLAFAADGSLYLSVLLFYPDRCANAVAVLRSTDGGATFQRPVLADERRTCRVDDDKNWITVDTSRASPHFGRIYQFWTPFLYDPAGRYTGSPQWVRWSDDQAKHWSAAHAVTPAHLTTQNSQPLVRPDGVLVDVYQQYGAGSSTPEQPSTAARPPRSVPGPRGAAAVTGTAAGPSARGRAGVSTGVDLLARRSRDGGATWEAPRVVARDIGEGPRGIRCCLASATADPVTGDLYAAWIGAGRGLPVRISRSRNGLDWTPGQEVSRSGRAATAAHVNVDVAAHAGRAFVSYGFDDLGVAGGRYVQQEVVASGDRGASFGPPMPLGPRSDLRFAARAGGRFPGDYIGTAAAGDRVYLVWCRSSAPSTGSGRYHQTVYGAVLRA